MLLLCFWDKILQHQEYELIQNWLNVYQSSSLFDIDMTITYGILSIISSKQITNAIEISCPSSTLYTLNLLRLSYRPDDLFDVCTASTIEENSPIRKQVYHNFEINNKDNDCSETKVETKITMRSSSDEVLHWLNHNSFFSVVNRFQYYTGVDLLRLTKNDIRQICNGDDAISIRLHYQLNETIIQSLKILYITLTNSDIYSTIYLHTLTKRELGEKCFELSQQPQQKIFYIIL
ncbi:unnamed protein product [Rotaria socialis]|uniref:SAM domain-containing protein n=1 Tax=Rotaria socialis TaxID=392032 RepID=A0A821DM66_9BILA|nr:unnamed protein product [Rotaria socialis]